MNLHRYLIVSSYTRELREEEKQQLKQFEEEHPDVLKQWVGIALGYNEYADGITGTNYSGRIVLENENNGFRLKSAIRKTLRENGIIIGKMKKVGNSMDGGIRRCGWDRLGVFKVPDMIDWLKKNNNSYRLSYSEWNYNSPIFPKAN